MRIRVLGSLLYPLLQHGWSCAQFFCGCNSGVESLPSKQLVAGSNPVTRLYYMTPSEEDIVHSASVIKWNMMCLLVKWGLVKNPDWAKLDIAFNEDWYHGYGWEGRVGKR